MDDIFQKPELKDWYTVVIELPDMHILNPNWKKDIVEVEEWCVDHFGPVLDMKLEGSKWVFKTCNAEWVAIWIDRKGTFKFQNANDAVLFKLTHS